TRRRVDRFQRRAQVSLFVVRGNDEGDHAVAAARSLSMWSRTIESKSASALKPMASARSVRNRIGHVFTIAWMRASGLNFTRSMVLRPATRPIASIISRTESVMPGRFTTRVVGHADD